MKQERKPFIGVVFLIEEIIYKVHRLTAGLVDVVDLLIVVSKVHVFKHVLRLNKVFLLFLQDMRRQINDFNDCYESVAKLLIVLLRIC